MRQLEYQQGRRLSYDEFHKLEIECFSGPYSSPLEYEHFSFQTVWSVFDGETLCGTLFAKGIDNRFHISKLAVGTAWRRRGIASHLISMAIEEARRMGYSAVTLNVLSHNQPARQLYQKNGFQPVIRFIRFEIAKEKIPSSNCVSVCCSGQGYVFPVRFLADRKEIGSGVMNTEIGGCKEFQIENPSEFFYPALAGLKRYLKPEQNQIYIMTSDSEFIEWGTRIHLPVESEIIGMQVSLTK